jgi:NAD-dependent deacetylase
VSRADPAAVREAAALLRGARRVVSFTGAGISVDSGIPDFRSSSGLWSRHDPMETFHIEAFARAPARTWEVLFDLERTLARAEPNPGHVALAELERLGRMDAVITQNIDNLHQRAGSGRVVEFHGNVSTLSCIHGHGRVTREDVREELAAARVPRCATCGFAMKPDVVFFGEAIPGDAIGRSAALARQCDLMLVAGTSAMVAPANQLPELAAMSGARVIVFDLRPTPVSARADCTVLGSTAETLPAVVDELRRLLS